MQFLKRLFGKSQKQDTKQLEEANSIKQDHQKYIKTGKIIARIDQLAGQDLSGSSYEKEVNDIVSLSPDCMRFIFDIWSKNVRASESTDALLVKVLGYIAKERPKEEKQLAIKVLQDTLDLPDDNTTRLMRRRNACIRILDEIQALPGVAYQNNHSEVEGEAFKLKNINSDEIGPIQSRLPQDKPNLEATALWQLIPYPQQHYEEVIQRFETNYSRWSKTFDPRSLSLVLCAYGRALEGLNRYREALIAHRWACKFYPYKGFSSCDHLPDIEARVTQMDKAKEKPF